ncbi:hypothetical protein PCLA_05r0501 [Pseudomonas citronellolis]|nr:hypothetical protein PCLA_05r0501 [Pseudomonas citronellolis]
MGHARDSSSGPATLSPALSLKGEGEERPGAMSGSNHGLGRGFRMNRISIPAPDSPLSLKGEGEELPGAVSNDGFSG